MQCATRPRITELNPHLLCVLCEGYLIDATAITECLHAFCKKCIVQYLETKKYCPVCDVLVHKTKPLQNLKPDKILQSIVYKSVPNLYENEMCNRRKFYSNIHPLQHPQNPELRGEITEASEFYTFNDTISLSLEYINFLGDQNYFYVASSSKRYLRCDAAVTIKHLQKLVSAKYGLAVKHEIRFFFNGIQLPEHLSLLDIAYISSWKRNGFIRLLYQILEVRKTVIKLEKKETTTATTTSKTPTAVNNQDYKVDKLPLDANNRVNNISEQAKESISSTSSVTTNSTAVATIAPTTTISAAIEIKSDESNIVKDVPNQRNPSPVSTSPSVNNISASVTTAISISTTSASLIHYKSNEKSVLNKIVEKLEKKAANGNLVNATTAGIVKPADKPDQSSTADKNNKENTERTSLRVEKCVEKSDVSVTGVSVQQTVTTASLKKKSQQDSPVPTKMPKLLNSDTLKSSKGDICKEVESINAPIMSVNSTASVTSSGLKFIPSNPLVATYNYTTPSTKSIPPVPALHKLPTFYPAARSNSSEPSKPIKFPTTTTTSIKKSITVTGSNIISRPWSYSTTSTAVAQIKPSTIPNVMKNTKEQKPIKFHKTRRNVPRFLGSPHSGITPLYGGNSSGGGTLTADGKVNPTNESSAKKPQKSMVLKVDPQTLAPITSSSTSSSKSASNASITTSKKPFYVSSKIFPSMSDYSCSVTNTPNYVSNLSAAAAAAAAAKLSSSAAAFNASYANMTHNPLLNTINPYLCGMYIPPFSPNPSDSAVNGPTSLDYIKAMTSFHPSCSPTLNSLYNPQHQHKFKPDKLKNPSKPTSSPPAIQRIPSTSKTPTTSEAATVSVASKSSPVPSTISNGVFKNKKKKEISSFTINNLIPIDEGKNTATHSCSADGINQVCDQVSSGSDLPSNKIGKEEDGCGKDDKAKCKEESIGTNAEKNASN